jgi:predicted nucleic acid-binding Zn ribbon protein
MEKIPQHKHCSQCGKAFIGDSRYCSQECKNKGEQTLKSRKKNLVVLYVVTLIILTLAVIIMAI